ncbi:MAG: SGNH hydrolase domain-containing protein [Thermodesulfobacteriota bacterium]
MKVRLLLAGYFSALLFLALTGLVIYFKGGLESRFDEEIYSLLKSDVLLSPWSRCIRETTDNYAGKSTCIINPGGNKTILVLGDSHADSYFPGIVDKFGYQYRIEHDAVASCGPFLGMKWVGPDGEMDCDAVNRQRLSRIAKMPPAVILIAARFSSYVETEPYFGTEKRGGGRWVSKKTGSREKNENIQVESISGFIKSLGDKPKIVILGQVPVQYYDPVKCHIRTKIANLPGGIKCDVLLSEVQKHMRATERLMAKLQSRFPGICIVDPKQALCTEDRCRSRIPEGLIYRDHSHLSFFGSKYLVRRLNFDLCEFSI